jgi:hypothetical protein
MNTPQIVGLLAVLGSPHLLEQLGLGDQLPVVTDEDLYDAPLGGRETDLASV